MPSINNADEAARVFLSHWSVDAQFSAAVSAECASSSAAVRGGHRAFLSFFLAHAQPWMWAADGRQRSASFDDFGVRSAVEWRLQ
jgi:hypothetical protein